MELFSAMTEAELNARLDEFGEPPHGFMLLAGIWKRWKTRDLATALWQTNCMIEQLEAQLVAAHAELVANGADA